MKAGGEIEGRGGETEGEKRRWTQGRRYENLISPSGLSAFLMTVPDAQPKSFNRFAPVFVGKQMIYRHHHNNRNI